MQTILVAGATGQQGGAVVDHLLSDGSWTVYGLTRDATSEAAEALEARGVTIVEGDMTDSERMHELVAGMDAVFGVTTFFEAGADGEIEQGRALAEAAAAADVDHVVFSSVGGADQNTGLAHFDSKYEVEQYLAELGVPTTVVRPVFFMQNFGYMMREQIEDGTLAMPLHDGVSLAVVDAHDIGQAVALALSDPEQFVGEVITLGGDERTLPEFAAAFSDHLGYDVEPVRLDVSEYREMAGDEMADMFQWFNDVGYDIDVDALEALGLDLTTFEEFLADSEQWHAPRTAQH